MSNERMASMIGADWWALAGKDKTRAVPASRCSARCMLKASDSLRACVLFMKMIYWYSIQYALHRIGYASRCWHAQPLLKTSQAVLLFRRVGSSVVRLVGVSVCAAVKVAKRRVRPQTRRW
jgi:hypothetical protein